MAPNFQERSQCATNPLSGMKILDFLDKEDLSFRKILI